jgi:hypothetical protein
LPRLEFENLWHSSNPLFRFMAWCVIKHRDSFTFARINLSRTYETSYSKPWICPFEGAWERGVHEGREA